MLNFLKFDSCTVVILEITCALRESERLSFFSRKYKIKLLKEYLLNMDISDGQNRPKIDRYMHIKEEYLKSVNPLVSKLSSKKQKQLLVHIKIGYGVQLIKADYKKEGIKCLISCICHPVVVIEEIKKYSIPFSESLLLRKRVTNTSKNF